MTSRLHLSPCGGRVHRGVDMNITVRLLRLPMKTKAFTVGAITSIYHRARREVPKLIYFVLFAETCETMGIQSHETTVNMMTGGR